MKVSEQKENMAVIGGSVETTFKLHLLHPTPPDVVGVRKLPWVVTRCGRLVGLAADREAAIGTARRAAKFRPAMVENKVTGEVWQGVDDDWRQTVPPQRIGG